MADNILQHPTNLFKKYFRERGIDDAMIANLGVKHLTDQDLIAALPGNGYIPSWVANGGTGALIPYIDAHGQPTDAYVVRLLGKFPGFSKMAKAYMPPKRRPRAHFPRSNPELERGNIVYLCESVLKAEVVSECGYFAIGINGCWGYSDKNTRDLLMPDIRDLPWELIGEVRVFYDSNYSTSDSVKAAATRFAIHCKQVINFDQVGVTILPPQDNGDEWGCDDAAVAMGKGWLCDVLDSDPVKPEISELDTKLMEMNDQCCVLEETGQIIRYDTHPIIPMPYGSFLRVNYADWKVAGVDAKGKDKMTSVPQAWLQWKKRNMVPRMVMKPNESKMVPGEFLNLWIDPKIEAGIPSEQWGEFISGLVSDPLAGKWLEQWIGHLVQKPGIKMTSFPLLVGPQGVGKSLVGMACASILGIDNTMTISQDDIESSYNGLHAVKLFTCIDEFYARDQGVGNKLKKIITEKVTIVNPKYGRQMTVESVCNYMITTNEMGALKLDEDDRRTGVVDCTPEVSHAGDIEYFAPLFEEVERDPGGILGYYLAVDLEGFSPYGTAPNSEAKDAMTEQRRSGYEAVAWSMVHDRVEFLESLNLDSSVQYFSLSMLGQKVSGMVGHQMQVYDRAMANKLNAAFRKSGLLTYKGNSTGQVSFKNQKHRIYCVPGADRTISEDIIRSDLLTWVPKVQGKQ